MIPEQYQFNTFSEFFLKRKKVKKWYKSCDDKWKYRYYCYSRIRTSNCRDDDIDCIWDYLNDFMKDASLKHYYYYNGGNKR